MRDPWLQLETMDDEVARRAELADLLSDDRELQGQVLARCRGDFDFWRANFSWLTDKDGQVIPAMPWNFHRSAQRLYLGLDGPRPPMMIAKSRMVGATHAILVEAGLWLWLFRKGTLQIVASRTEDLVDNQGDDYNQGLFPKLRFLVQRLPWWQLPKAFRDADRPRRLDRHMFLLNPDTRSSFLGTSTARNAGRSLRAFRIFIDEANSIVFLEDMIRAMGMTGPTCSVSSVGGRHTHFARMFHGDAQDLSTNGGQDKKLTPFLWKYTDRPWEPGELEGIMAGMSTKDKAQELECNFCASTPGQIWSPTSANKLSMRQWLALSEERSRGITVHAWDFGQSAALTCWLSCTWLPKSKVLIVEDYRQWSDTTAERIAQDLHGAGWYADREPDWAVGDPYGEKQGAKTHNGATTNHVGSWLDNLRAAGISIRGQSLEIERAIAEVGKLIDEVRLLFAPSAQARRPDQPLWPSPWDCAQSYRREEDDPAKWAKKKPPERVKDIYSHGADALQHAVWRVVKKGV
jgi:hypothetical protein